MVDFPNMDSVLLQWGVVIGTSFAAAFWFDVRTGRIPNKLTGPMFLAGIVFMLTFNGFEGLFDGFAAAGLMGFPYMIAFVFGAGGAGDVKLMAASGMWLGLSYSILALPCVAGVGVMMAAAKAIRARRVRVLGTAVVLCFYDIIFKLRGQAGEGSAASYNDDLTMPYGLAIFGGLTLAALIEVIR